MRLFRPHWDAIGTPRQPPTLEPAGIEEQLRAGLHPVEDGRDLACVVLSFRTQPGLAAAVESMLSQDRSARQARYVELDPDRRWQAIGYEYPTDETGLRLERIRGRRGYR